MWEDEGDTAFSQRRLYQRAAISLGLRSRQCLNRRKDIPAGKAGGWRLAVEGWRSKAGKGWAHCTCLLYWLTPCTSQALAESPPAQRRLLPLTLDRLPQQTLLKCMLSDFFACHAGRLACIVCHLLMLNIWQLLVNYCRAWEMAQWVRCLLLRLSSILESTR